MAGGCLRRRWRPPHHLLAQIYGAKARRMAGETMRMRRLCTDVHSNKKRKRLKLRAKSSESVNEDQGSKAHLLRAKSRQPRIANDGNMSASTGMTCTYCKMCRSKHWSHPRRLCWWPGCQRIVIVVDSERRGKKTGSVTMTQRASLFLGLIGLNSGMAGASGTRWRSFGR